MPEEVVEHQPAVEIEGVVAVGLVEVAVDAVAQRDQQQAVALAEEGWADGPVAEAIARRYLEPVFGAAAPPDTLLLGCTHFPALLAPIRRAVGEAVAIVDSAQTTARATAEDLAALGLARREGIGRLTLLATDGPERFARVGAIFAGEAVAAEDVELVDL